MFFVYENVELKGTFYDVRVEQYSTRVVVTDVYENDSNNEITNTLSADDIKRLEQILNFELGYM